MLWRRYNQKTQTLREAKIDETFLEHMQSISNKSLLDQQEIEASDSINFETFLEQWNNF